MNASERSENMIAIGQAAPKFSGQAVVNKTEIREINSADYLGKWIVLFFYPLDFTFVCPTELLQFRDKMADFQKLNAVILGCSVDSVFSHKKWLADELGDVGYPLIGDITKRISRDFGVLLEDQGIATRGTFVIDPEGHIQYAGIHNLNVGRDAGEILRVLNALQSGELCAAGWKPGQAHLKAK